MLPCSKRQIRLKENRKFRTLLASDAQVNLGKRSVVVVLLQGGKGVMRGASFELMTLENSSNLAVISELMAQIDE